MSSPATVDDLALEMLCELFKHLNPRNLAACSMVNKRWHSAYSSFRVHRLAIIDHFNRKCLFRHLDKWYYSRRNFEVKELCPPDNFSRLVFKPLLSNLKHLALSYSYGQCQFTDLNKLNVFGQLKHLEININLGGKKVNLNLPRLELLAVHCKNRGLLSIDCP